MKKYILKSGFHGHLYFPDAHIYVNNILACKEKRGNVIELQVHPQTRMIAGFFAYNIVLQDATEVTGEYAQWT